jgi:hypothetical protein
MTVGTSALAETREALHQVAEHVLAAAQYAEAGTVRLRVVTGGFETVRDLRDGRLGVIDGRLVVTDGAGTRSAALSTVAAAADFVGATAGLPAQAYRAATALTPDAALVLDPASVQVLVDWYGLSDSALREFAAQVGAPEQQPTLWPEHFDVGITVDAVNYGASPGDGRFATPYLYVGPHDGPPRRDDFWNAEFGAVRLVDDITSAADAVAFFGQGRARLHAQGEAGAR